MRDVAALAGVSTKTVSNVINDYPYIRPETKARVKVALQQLGYQMNHSARQLRSGRTGIISLALPEVRQPYFAELVHSVIDEAQQVGLTVVVETTLGVRERELEVLRGGPRHLVDGLIFNPVALAQSDIGDLPNLVPTVMLAERVLGPVQASLVAMNDREAAKAAVAHLAAVGCRRIAVIGTQDTPMMSPQRRLQGYLDGLAEAGLPFDPELQVGTDDWHREAGALAAGRLLDEGVAFDALFCFNDAMALGALWELSHRGIAVPGEVAVVGFDDTEDARFATPTLTSIEPGRALIARAAVQLLVERLSGAPVRPHDVVVDFTLIPRESTAR